MKTIEERNSKLVENSSRYSLLSKLFLLHIIMLLIAFISTSLISDRIQNSDEIEMLSLLGIFISFILYKWANEKKQHIETIRYYKKLIDYQPQRNS